MTATLAPDVDTASSDELADIRATIDAGLKRHAKDAATDERQRTVINAALKALLELGTVPEPGKPEPAPVKAAA